MRKTLQDYNALSSSKIDADAVCVQCGTVNPEGTLICRKCGNNLRDQRRLRLQAEEQLRVGEESLSTRKIVWGIIAFIGAIFIVIAGLNADSIMMWLVSSSSGFSFSTESPWSGELGKQLSILERDLKAQIIASNQIYAAIQRPVNSENFEGVFIIAVRNVDGTFAPVGKAIVKPTEDKYLFVALLDNEAQVRGFAQKQNERFVVYWENASCEWNAQRGSASGIVSRREDGRYEGYGGTELTNENFEFYAFKLP